MLEKEHNRLFEDNQFLKTSLDHSEQERATTLEKFRNAQSELEITQKQVLDLEVQNKTLDRELRKASEEAAYWQDRQRITEQEKINEVTRLSHEKKEAIELLTYEKEKMKRQLESEIDSLTLRLKKVCDDLDDCSKELKNTQLALASEQSHSRSLEQKNAAQELLYRDTCEKHLKEMSLKDAIHCQEMDKARSIHDYERGKLKNDISQLNNLIYHKTKETEDQKLHNNRLNASLIEKERKLMSTAQEALYHRSRADREEREKSLE